MASLAFALQHAVKNNMERIIYVIPYTSIIEQNAKVFSRFIMCVKKAAYRGSWLYFVNCFENF